MKSVDYLDGELLIRFTGDDFKKGLVTVKGLFNALFHPKGKFWTASFTEKNIRMLQEDNWEFSLTLQSMINSKKKKKEVKIDESKMKDFMPCQIEGVKFLEEIDGKGLITDEMGVGKTLQAIGYAKIHPELRPVLIICPASLKLNWAREIERWTGDSSIEILYGMTPYPVRKANWYIINYDILGRDGRTKEEINLKKRKYVVGWVNELIKMKIAIVVADEFQLIANSGTDRTVSTKTIVKQLKDVKIIGLSGTPINNRPREFYTVLNLVAPKIFPSRYNFERRYCDPKFNGFTTVCNGATNIEELHELIKPLMIRRLKKDVLKELPPKRKIILPLELEEVQRKNYNNAEGEFLDWLEDNYRNYVMVQEHLEKLKQIAYLAKRNSVLAWIDDFLSSGEKLVVMTYHKIAMDDIYSKFKKIAVKIDGSTKASDRQKAVDDFQNNPDIKLFVGQIIAAGVGITLTAASTLAFVEYSPVPAHHAQAEDRIHRKGQTESVSIVYLTADGTVETKIAQTLVSKSKVISRLVDGEKQEFFDGQEKELTVEILDKYKRVR